MLNGKKIEAGAKVVFTMFTNWTFEQGSKHTVTHVSEMNDDGWFDIKLLNTDDDWHCCLHFSMDDGI